jgi:hypothetical protein
VLQQTFRDYRRAFSLGIPETGSWFQFGNAGRQHFIDVFSISAVPLWPILGIPSLYDVVLSLTGYHELSGCSIQVNDLAESSQFGTARDYTSATRCISRLKFEWSEE